MANVRVNPATAAKIRASLRSPLAREMLRRGVRVESAAKKRISHSPRRVDTGRLRASITTEQFIRGNYPGVRVGSNVEYALYVHNGTRHMEPNPYLRDALPAARL